MTQMTPQEAAEASVEACADALLIAAGLWVALGGGEPTMEAVARKAVDSMKTVIQRTSEAMRDVEGAKE